MQFFDLNFRDWSPSPPFSSIQFRKNISYFRQFIYLKNSTFLKRIWNQSISFFFFLDALITTLRQWFKTSLKLIEKKRIEIEISIEFDTSWKFEFIFKEGILHLIHIYIYIYIVNNLFIISNKFFFKDRLWKEDSCQLLTLT